MTDAVRSEALPVDFCVVIPTVGTRCELVECLASLGNQSRPPQLVVVVDPRGEAQALLKESPVDLKVAQMSLGYGSQVEQRRIGLEYALRLYPDSWVVFLDDDIWLAPDALQQVEEAIEEGGPNLGAVCMSLGDESRGESKSTGRRKPIVKRAADPGRVTRSGRNIPFIGASDGDQVQWVRGGTSVWRGAILRQNQSPRFPSRYASMEDVIFSYPLGKSWELRYSQKAMCSALRLDEEFPSSQRRSVKQAWIRTLHRAYLVWANPSLSRGAFLAAVSVQGLRDLVLGGITLRRHRLFTGVGSLIGVTQAAVYGFLGDRNPNHFFVLGPEGIALSQQQLDRTNSK